MKRPRKPRFDTAAPAVVVAETLYRDDDGDLWVQPAGNGSRKSHRPAPQPVRLAPGGREAAPGLGEKVLVRIETLENGEAVAHLIKRLGGGPPKMLGVVRKRHREAMIEPVEKGARGGLILNPPDAADLRDGDLVLAQTVAAGQGRFGPRRGKVVEVIGHEDDARAASLIAIAAHNIPMGFSDQALVEAESVRPPTPDGRKDLTGIPLITIDPPDARDHDDAVYAEADPDHPGGWIVWVAIADVAYAVPEGSALDRNAWEKGNSVYFPDRVEPMLPEALSAGLCSLTPGDLRPCLAVRMVFDAEGRKRNHRFERGLMRSAAKLSYEAAQAAIDGHPDVATRPLLETVLKPLWAAYRTLTIARARRSPLEIESQERRVEFGPDGEVRAITARVTREANRLIEEFMIQANVAAAETLDRAGFPCIWRVHDAPSALKIAGFVDFLASLEIPWSKGEAARTERFNRLLAATREGPNGAMINEMVLRTQSQAVYSTENIGHFGLNLDRYVHFTSPIRRYADLTVHRGLLSIMGHGGARPEPGSLERTAEHVSMTERRAMAAERDAADRYTALFLYDQVGGHFSGVITGVTRFGLFVRLDETGADGLVPIASLGEEYFHHDAAAHALIGERSGATWRLGQAVEVALREAAPVTGGLILEMLSEGEAGGPRRRAKPGFKPSRSRTDRQTRRGRR